MARKRHTVNWPGTPVFSRDGRTSVTDMAALAGKARRRSSLGAVAPEVLAAPRRLAVAQGDALGLGNNPTVRGCVLDKYGTEHPGRTGRDGFARGGAPRARLMNADGREPCLCNVHVRQATARWCCRIWSPR